MSKQGNDDWMSALKTLSENMSKMSAQYEQRAEAERQRRAQLTPAQRAAEDAEATSQRTADEREKIRKRFARMGDAIMKRETWTVEKFCWLLVAENPEDDDWGFFSRSTKAQQQHKTYTAILRSCEGTLLTHVNPTDPPDQRRFAVGALIEVARDKKLGFFEVLAEIVDPRASSQRQPVSEKAPEKVSGLQEKKKTLPQIGLENREQQKARRRRDLTSYARSLIGDNDDKHQGPIRLPIRGVELNEQFRAAFPEWESTSDATLKRDRREMRPRIEVAPGRPPNKNE